MNSECIKMLKCVVCGKEFRLRPNKKTCSQECAKVLKRASVRKYRKAMRLARRTPRKCLHCGKVFTPKHGAEILCSDECRRERAFRQTMDSRQAKRGGPWTPKPVACIHCGKMFTPRSRQERICSDECRRLAKNASQNRLRAKRRADPEGRESLREQQRMWYEMRKAKRVAAGLPPVPPAKPKVKDPRKPIKCEYCGKEFQPRAKDVKYCSPRCRMKTMLARKRAANVERLTLKCVHCGKEFLAERTTRKYCSYRCQREFARERNREWQRIHGRKRDWRAEAERREKLRYSHGQSCGNILMGVSRRIIEEIGDEVFGPLAAGY